MGDVEQLHPMVQQADAVLRDTYSFFSRSAKRFQAWKRYANAHGITECGFSMFNTTPGSLALSVSK